MLRKYLLPFVLFIFVVCACEKAPEEVRVESVSLSQPTAEMLVGESVQLSATVLPSNATDKTVIWASSKQSVATVTESGRVTAIAEGVSTITASAGGAMASCTVTVQKIEVSSIVLDKVSLVLGTGQTATLIASIEPNNASDKTVVWSSSDKSVASVDDHGTVTAQKKGTTYITAKAGNQIATCAVSVYTAVQSVRLDKSELNLLVGDTYSLVGTINPQDAEIQVGVTWQTSEASVASVTNDGLVSAVSEGMAIITFSVDGKSATCKVICERTSGGIENIGSENWK